MAHPISRPSLPRPLVVAAALLATLAGAAFAQDPLPLEALAPAETVLAVGLSPVDAPQGDLHDALAELDWAGAREALDELMPLLREASPELADALGAFGSAGDAADELGRALDPDAALDELRAACPAATDALEAGGSGAWLDDALVTVSMDAFAPLPAGLLAIRTHADAGDAAGEAYDAAVDCFASDTAGQQDGTTLHVLGDGSDLPLVTARRGDLILAGTRPDVVRAALRRAGGADEPSFARTAPGAAATAFGPGLRVTLHTAAIAEVAVARVPTLGDPMLALARERATAALRTLGGVGLRVAPDDDGIGMETVVAFDREGGDAELAALLACDGCRASGPFLAPADAVRVSGTVWRPDPWFDYVDGWVRDLSRADGEPTDLRTLLLQETGVDVDDVLLDWVGRELQLVRLEGLTPDLRDLVLGPPTGMILPVASPEAAERGMTALAAAARDVYGRAAADDDDLPDDLADVVSVRDAEADGVPYRRIRIGPANDLAVGTIGSRLVIASPASAFASFVAVERGEVDNGFASDGWARLSAASGGADLAAWTYGDGGADLEGVADLLDLVAQPAAFAAATGLDALLQGSRDEPFGAAPPRPSPAPDRSPGARVDVATADRYDALDLDAAEAVALAPGDAVTGELTPATPEVGGTPMVLYRLQGLEPGATYTLEMSSGPVDTYLYLIDEGAGAYLAENDDAPSTSRSAITFVADEGSELLAGAGSFGSAGDGPFTVRLLTGEGATADAPDVATLPGYGQLTTAGEPAFLRVPTEVTGQLSSAGDGFRLQDRVADVYRLDGLAPGDVVTVEMTSDPLDTYLHLFDADSGAILQENDDAPFTDRSELRFTAGGERALAIAAGSWGGSSEGPYRLSVTVDAADDAADEPDAPTAPEEAPGAAPGDDPAAGDAEAPTFDELLTLTDALVGTVRTIGDRLGPVVGWTTVTDDDRVRSVQHQSFDW